MSTTWVDRTKEVESLATELFDRIFDRIDLEDTATDPEAFREEQQEQVHAVALAKGTADYDLLRVFSQYEASDADHPNHALALVVRSLRTAGVQEVFPVLDTLNMTEAVRVSLALAAEYRSNSTGLLFGASGEVSDALRAATAMGSKTIANYISANTLKVLEMVVGRNIIHSASLIALLEAMLSDSITPLQDGAL